jgi:hypothetical protein
LFAVTGNLRASKYGQEIVHAFVLWTLAEKLGKSTTKSVHTQAKLQFGPTRYKSNLVAEREQKD